MKIYIIWLIGVILWNFGYPEAAPILDVLAAIILSLLSFGLKNILIKILLRGKKNILVITNCG